MDLRRLRRRMVNAPIDFDDANDNDDHEDLPIAIPLLGQQLEEGTPEKHFLVRCQCLLLWPQVSTLEFHFFPQWILTRRVLLA